MSDRGHAAWALGQLNSGNSLLVVDYLNDGSGCNSAGLGSSVRISDARVDPRVGHEDADSKELRSPYGVTLKSNWDSSSGYVLDGNLSILDSGWSWNVFCC